LMSTAYNTSSVIVNLANPTRETLRGATASAVA
jgi:hypothetical protein